MCLLRGSVKDGKETLSKLDCIVNSSGNIDLPERSRVDGDLTF